MRHKIISFYATDLAEEVVEAQKKVFNYFKIDLEQSKFYKGNTTDSSAITNHLSTNNDWDYVTIVDVDCIPLTSDCFTKALEAVKDGDTMYGNAQCSNVFDHNPYKSLPYVGPHFCSFSKKIWLDITNKFSGDIFSPCLYPNPNGDMTEADRGEFFTREVEKLNYKIVLAYPTKVWGEAMWKYSGVFGGQPFTFGGGTEYESETYHNFEIRIPERRDFFLNYCKNLINEN